MPQIKNVSGDDLVVPWLGGRLVLAGQVVDVDEGDVYAFTCQEPNWAPADDAAQAEHDAAEAEANPEPVEKPAGNASRDLWAAYVVAAGLATEEQIADMSRDQLRDTYGSEG